MAIFYPFSRLRPLDKQRLISNQYLTPDNELFEMLSFSYAINHPSMNTSECNPLRNFGDDKNPRYPVINRAFYNPINGSMQDYK